jgi:hypothetical protein
VIEFESKIGSTNRLCVRAAAVVADAKRQSFDSVRVAYQRYRISLKNAGNVIFHDRNCIGDWWSAIVVCLLLASRGLAMSCKLLAVSLEKHVSVLKTYPELDVIGRATHDAAINILAIDQPTSPTWKKKIYKTADPKVVFNNRGAGVVALRDDDEFLVGDSEPAALVDDIADRRRRKCTRNQKYQWHAFFQHSWPPLPAEQDGTRSKRRCAKRSASAAADDEKSN